MPAPLSGAEPRTAPLGPQRRMGIQGDRLRRKQRRCWAGTGQWNERGESGPHRPNNASGAANQRHPICHPATHQVKSAAFPTEPAKHSGHDGVRDLLRTRDPTPSRVARPTRRAAGGGRRRRRAAFADATRQGRSSLAQVARTNPSGPGILRDASITRGGIDQPSGPGTKPGTLTCFSSNRLSDNGACCKHMRSGCLDRCRLPPPATPAGSP